jgi:hypothetical protein
VCGYDLLARPCPHPHLASALAPGRRVGCAGALGLELRPPPGRKIPYMDEFDSRLPAALDPAAVIAAVARDPRLRAFTGHGRIETLPARQARRHLLLDKIAQAFEPGVRYSERQVSLFLGALHADYAALRRYLVDEEFLSRSDGQYWRSGGTVLPSPPDERWAQALPAGS